MTLNSRYVALAGALVLVVGTAIWLCHPSPSPAPLGPHRIVDVEFDPNGGTDLRINGAGVRCGADRVVSVQSRTYTNQGDIEFWCREVSQTVPEFKDIGKGDSRLSESSVANISGRLYEAVSQSYYTAGRWESNLWKRVTRRIDRMFGDQTAQLMASGRVVNLQKRGGKTYRFVVSDKVCTGLSLFSDDGYYGTYQNADWPALSAMYTDGKIIAANIGRRMRIGQMPDAGPLNHCRPLELKPVGPSDWVYAITPVPGGLLYGGSLSPPYVGCAQLRFLDLKTLNVRSIPLPDCSNKLVTEFYSFAKHGNELLIGNYPYARLYAIDPKTLKVRLTNLAAVRPNDHFYGGVPYRESQSVLSAYGAVWVGLYPWAELLFIDGKTTKALRILQEPPKNGSDFAPYVTLMRKNMLRRTGAPNIKAIPTARKDWARVHALYMDSWAQRIPSVTLFSGRVCLSTASFAGFSYDPDLHPLPADAAKKYGDVFCADLPNHVLIPKTKQKVHLVITDHHIGIERDGVAIASTEHHLSQRALQEIAAAAD